MNEVDLAKVDKWLRGVLWEGQLPDSSVSLDTRLEVHRLKGRIVLRDGSVKMIQGVREVFEIFDAPNSPGQAAQGKIVIIGRGLTGLPFQESIETALR
jgi:hypothetical protein